MSENMPKLDFLFNDITSVVFSSLNIDKMRWNECNIYQTNKFQQQKSLNSIPNSI